MPVINPNPMKPRHLARPPVSPDQAGLTRLALIISLVAVAVVGTVTYTAITWPEDVRDPNMTYDDNNNNANYNANSGAAANANSTANSAANSALTNRSKISENESPASQGRLSFYYQYFDQVTVDGCHAVAVQRFDPADKSVSTGSLAVSLSATAGSIEFFSDVDCTTAGSVIVIPDGSISIPFSFIAKAAGPAELTATADQYESATQDFTVKAK